MDFFYAALLGAVQGISEFLPISSSAHLLILHRWLSFEAGNELTFDVALHIGTTLAMLIYFSKDIIHYLRTKPKLLAMIVVATIPAGIAGAVGESYFEEHVRSLPLLAVMMLAVSALFFYVEHRGKQIKTIDQVTWRDAIIVGLAQVLALMPGTSRSGITTSAAMLQGYKRVDAARFSFLLALPITAGAVAKKMLDLWQGPAVSTLDWQLMIVGIVVSGVVGIISIAWLLKFFQKFSLRAFAWYRIALAIVVFASWLVFYR